MSVVRHRRRRAVAEGTPSGGSRVGRTARWFDDRLGVARTGRTLLDKIFPNHWSFLLGEIALYSFVVLLATGVYLTFFFDASSAPVVYDGSYAPLQGLEVSAAYNSALDLSFDVRAGLMMRQVHHWAALLFVAAVVVHLCRVFFTGAFRKPRELNWVIGCTLLVFALGNGFAGYSLLDDQLSGTGIRIADSVILSIPVVGTWISSLLFGGDFPGTEIIPRLFIIHVLLLPAGITVLLVAHLGILVRHKHTHFRGDGATEDNVVGERVWPTYAAKAGGVFFLTAALLCLLGGLFQINPIWLYGPFEVADVSSASQPDWYIGWLEGSLRLMSPWEVSLGDYLIPNPFFPGVLLPGVTFLLLYAWPWLEARFTHDHDVHHVLDRPRDRPVRTALGVATLTFYVILFAAGATDVLAVTFGLSVNRIVWTFRTLLLVAPPVAAFVAHRVCRELQLRDGPPEPLPDASPPSDGDAAGAEAAADPAAEPVGA